EQLKMDLVLGNPVPLQGVRNQMDHLFRSAEVKAIKLGFLELVFQHKIDGGLFYTCEKGIVFMLSAVYGLHKKPNDVFIFEYLYFFEIHGFFGRLVPEHQYKST